MKKLTHEQMIWAIKWCAAHVDTHADDSEDSVKALSYAAESIIGYEHTAVEHGQTKAVNFNVALDMHEQEFTA